MRLEPIQMKQIHEVKYLSTDNTWRYRTIIRFMYKQYEKMKYWMYKEDIFEYLKGLDEFKNYSVENLKNDLDSLVEWRNVLAIADTAKVKTIEEFKNREFRYQLSTYTIEIERMLRILEHMTIENHATLEAVLIDRFHILLANHHEVYVDSPQKIYGWWKELNGAFKELNQNYQDYIACFYSPKTEELMKTTEFLLFKERFVKYLRDFIRGIQVATIDIQKILNDITEEEIRVLLNKVLEYEKSIGNLALVIDQEDYIEMNLGRFESMKEWFIGDINRASLVEKLIESTNEIIRKITRFAAQIAERKNNNGNRKEEYRKIAELFEKCETVEEAGKLSALIFGSMGTMHIKANPVRETESINSSIFEEIPTYVETKPRIRTYREKLIKTPIQDKTLLKAQKREEVLRKRIEEEVRIQRFVSQGELDFGRLGRITTEDRVMLLKWLTKGKGSKENWHKTELGKTFQVVLVDGKEQVSVECEDGIFIMPHYKILFKGDE
ncbi:MAG: TIGR02677 family protein [Cellulosilyticaceae bacterium]